MPYALPLRAWVLRLDWWCGVLQAGILESSDLLPLFTYLATKTEPTTPFRFKLEKR
jgi:hypothetical protein